MDIVGCLVSIFIEAELALSVRARSRLKPKLINRSLYVPADCSAWGRLVPTVERIRATVLTRIGFMHNQWQEVAVSRKLAGMIVGKFNLQRFVENSKLGNVPGTRLQRLAKFLFSKRTYALVLEPILRDIFDEYCQALSQGENGKARWVRVRGYWSFWSAIIAQTPISVVKKIYQIWKVIP